jgi:hypothetical protein
MKNLTAYLMLLVIALLTVVVILKIWIFALIGLPIQIYIAIKEKAKLNFIATFFIFLFVETFFSAILIGIWKLIKLI